MEQSSILPDEPVRQALRGSVKTRALMIANHYANVNRFGKPLLSPEQMASLQSSFDSYTQRRQFETYSRYFQNVETYLTNISQMRGNYQEALQRLDKFLLLRQSNQDLEDMGNAMLKGVEGQIDQLFAAKEARNLIGRAGDLRSVKVRIGKNSGYIQVLDGPRLDIEVAKGIISELTTGLVKIKTAIAVVRDFEKETKFIVKVFHEYPKVVQAWIKGQDEQTPLLIMDKKARAKATSPRMREVLELVEAAPTYDQTEIDPKQYETEKRGLYGQRS